MIAIHVDHNIEGQAALLLSALATEGWLELGLFRLFTFADVSLPFDSRDREVWQFVQERGMLFLDRIIEKTYREQCATRLAEIVFDLDGYLGAGRLYLP